MPDKDSTVSFIRNEITKLKNNKISFRDSNVVICCPFHKDSYGQMERTPSCSVNLTGTKYNPGTFHCFGCDESGSWNKLAKKLNLKSLTQTDVDRNKLLNPSQLVSTEDRNYLLGIKEKRILDDNLPWDPDKNWRGISGRLLDKIGAVLSLHQKTNELQLYLPVSILNQLVGGINCRLEKVEGQKSYFNDPGAWAKKSLFPYDYIKSLELKYVILVEGPRDALRLIQAGLPALAILGTYSWGDAVISLLRILNLKTIVLGFDKDPVGQAVLQKAHEDLKHYYRLIRLNYPEGAKDPCDLSPLQLKKLKSKLLFAINRKI